jgi:hypothetical protein
LDFSTARAIATNFSSSCDASADWFSQEAQVPCVQAFHRMQYTGTTHAFLLQNLLAAKCAYGANAISYSHIAFQLCAGRCAFEDGQRSHSKPKPLRAVLLMAAMQALAFLHSQRTASLSLGSHTEAAMKKTSLAILLSALSLTGTASAQGASSGISESTDPAKAEAVERRAADIQAQQQAAEQQATSGGSGSTKKSTTHGHTKKKTGKSGKAKSGDTSGTSGNTSDQDGASSK